MYSENVKNIRKDFSYEELWSLQEPQKKPHKQRADDLGICFDDLPVNPTLKIIRVDRDITEEMNDEEIIDWAECQRRVIANDYKELDIIPHVVSEIVDLRQIEDGVDVSAFNTADWLRGKREFNKVAYAKQQIVERIKDLAILYSCISSEQGRNNTKRKALSLLENKHKAIALAYLKQMQNTSDFEKKQELRRKILQINAEIRHLLSIWKKFSSF